MGNPKLGLKASVSGEGARQALCAMKVQQIGPGVQSPDGKEGVSTNSQPPTPSGREGR